MSTVACFFHRLQLSFRPRYEWALGERIEHPERTERADQILKSLQHEPNRFEVFTPQRQPLDEIAALHYPELLELYKTAESLAEGETFYPSVYLHNHALDIDTSNIYHTGHFCFDSGTPLNRETRTAAVWSAACALSAAEAVRGGQAPLAYALSRPPGHHASEGLFGGYCYFNNAAIAATYFRQYGRVAVLDIDAHHGNGTQSIFWRDPEVLTISIHADPAVSFPFFLGYRNERGQGEGLGRNINIPLPKDADGQEFLRVLEDEALAAIRTFMPKHLVIAAGVDAYKLDPVGLLSLETSDFYRAGELIAQTKLPLCVVQEGGYYTPDIGTNVLAVLSGMRDGCGIR